jgi:hypothetical protein
MIKTVNQQIIISQGMLDLMSKFRNMVNDCIGIGLQNNVTSFDIRLDNFVLKTISTLKVHSFSISSLGKLSISYSKS